MVRRPRILILAASVAVLVSASACHEESASKSPAPAEAKSAASEDHAPISEFPCVRFEDLRRHLPKALEGFRRTHDEGSNGRYGEVSISEAERIFSGGEGKEIAIRIVDTTMAGELGRAIRAAANDASSRKPDDPTAPIIGQSTVGFVRYDPNRQRAEASLLVADRFVVAVTARGFEGTQEVRHVAADEIDLTGLALLR